MTDKQAKDIEAQAQRVLQNPNNASSEAIYELLESCIDRAQELEKRMATEAAKASDPTVTSSDGGRAARTASEDARLDAARHRKLELMLRDLLERVLDREQRDRWNSDHQRVGVVIEQTDVGFNRLPGLIEEMASILADCQHADALSSELAVRAPAGEDRRFTRYRDRDRELFDRTVLCFGGVQLYPPRTTIDVERICPPVPHRRAWTSEWWRDGQEQRQRDEARVADELQRMQREKEEFYGQRP